MPRIMLAGTGETMQYSVHDYNDNTIRFILRYPGAVDAELMQRAVQAVVFSVDVLHASFCPGKLRGWWKVNRNVPAACYFSCLQAEDPAAEAIARALEPVAPGGLCQLRCTLVQGREDSLLTANISHLCVDGSDGKYLLQKIAEAYRLLRATGSTAGLTVKNGSRAAEQVYGQLTRQDMRQLLHNPNGGVRSAFPFPSAEEGTPRLTLRIIPAKVMTAARRRARDVNASANDLLLAACYHACAALPGMNAAPMSIMGMMDLRKHCLTGDSQGLCNMSGTLCTTLPEGPAADFSTTLALIAAQTCAAKADPLAGLAGLPLVHGATRALPLSILLKCVGWIYGSFSIGLTNLGRIDCEALTLDGLSPDGGLFGGPLKRKPGMQVSAASFNGECTLCIAGQYTPEDAALLQWLLDAMADQLARYAANA